MWQRECEAGNRFKERERERAKMGMAMKETGDRVCLVEKKRNGEEGEGGFILVITRGAHAGLNQAEPV